MIKTPNGQNKLVNKIFSVEGLILVIVLTALGLSIAAFSMPCKSSFGIPGESCEGNVDGNKYCKNSAGEPAHNEICLADGGLCSNKSTTGTCHLIDPKYKCVGTEGMYPCIPHVNDQEFMGPGQCADWSQQPSAMVPGCRADSKTKEGQRQKNQRPEAIENACCPQSSDCNAKGRINTYCSDYSCQTYAGGGTPSSDDWCYKYDDSPTDCCGTNGCAWYGTGANSGYCANGQEPWKGPSTNCCSKGKYTPGIDYAACKYGTDPYIPIKPIPPSSPTPMPPSSPPPHKTGGFGGKTGGFGGKTGGFPPPGFRPPTVLPISPSPPPSSPHTPPPSHPHTSPPGSPSGSSHDNSHLVLIISAIVVGVILIGGGVGVYTMRRGKM